MWKDVILEEIKVRSSETDFSGMLRRVGQCAEKIRRFWDKTSLDLFWIKDKSLADLDSLPEPDVLAADIIENL